MLFAVLFNDLPWEKAKASDADFRKIIDAGGVDKAGIVQFEYLAPGMRDLLSGYGN